MSQLSWHDTIPYRIAKFCVYYAKQFTQRRNFVSSLSRNNINECNFL